MNYSLQMNKTNIIGPLPVAQPGKPMQPSAHSATSRIKWAVAFEAKPLRQCFALPPPLPRGGLGIPQSFASSPEAPLPGATATTAASGGNRESLLGQRPAGCKRQRSRRWEPQPGLVERSETERLDEGQPDRKPLTFGHSETGDAVCLYIICPMTAA